MKVNDKLFGITKYNSYICTMDKEEFENFGYPSDEKCVACSSTDTRAEPRFYYSVCIEHFKLTPVELNKFK